MRMGAQTPMKTQPPCFDKATKTDCPRRYIGCKAECGAWHEWLAVHDAEMQKERQAKDRFKDAEDFLATQGERSRKACRREYMRGYNK